MRLIEISLQIALRAYAGKVDKAGREYILHPLRVMAKMRTELEMSAALLHDVLEDSEITAEELLAEGIPAEVVEAVQHLTKMEEEEYMDFVARAGKNRIAAAVKLADIEYNIDVLRLSSLDETDLARVRSFGRRKRSLRMTYHSAWRFLKQEGTS